VRWLADERAHLGLPDNSDEILTYAKEVSNLKSRLVKPMPLLVHCSAGIGRTGVFLMLELGLFMMQHEKDVNVPALLTKLREQRLNLIQTEVSLAY
jgi:protein tyrosine phosphatase